MPVFNQIIQQQGQGALGPLALQQIGSVFDEEISVPTALQEALIAKGLTVPPPERGRALIDTGATFSAVENTIMTRLGVPPVGITSVGTAGGRHMANQYPAKFTLTLGNGSISFEIPRATGVNMTDQPYIALIGRNLLANVVMIYNGGLGIITLAI